MQMQIPRDGIAFGAFEEWQEGRWGERGMGTSEVRQSRAFSIFSKCHGGLSGILIAATRSRSRYHVEKNEREAKVTSGGDW